MSRFEQLLSPRELGVQRIAAFMGTTELRAIRTELDDPERVTWHNHHETLPANGRGLQVEQHYDSFALKLGMDDKRHIQRLPHIEHAILQMRSYVRDNILPLTPACKTWTPNDVSVQRYNRPDIGITRHRDNKRFVGIVAVLCVSAIADFVVTRDDKETVITVGPGDVVFMRAPGIVTMPEEERPEHSVRNLRDLPRISLTLREDTRPDEPLVGATYANWQPAQPS